MSPSGCQNFPWPSASQLPRASEVRRPPPRRGIRKGGSDHEATKRTFWSPLEVTQTYLVSSDLPFRIPLWGMVKGVLSMHYGRNRGECQKEYHPPIFMICLAPIDSGGYKCTLVSVTAAGVGLSLLSMLRGFAICNRRFWSSDAIRTPPGNSAMVPLRWSTANCFNNTAGICTSTLTNWPDTGCELSKGVFRSRQAVILVVKTLSLKC